MPSRSWMAAWILGAVVLAPSIGRCDDPAPNKVKLTLVITGVTGKETIVLIQPAHPGCRFKPVNALMDTSKTRNGTITTKPIALDVVSMSADRDCSFLITLREAGQPPKVYHRGIRLQPSASAPEQEVTMFLTAPSLATREQAERSVR